MEIDSHLGCAMSGLTADARTMIDHARVTAQNHSFTYDEKIKVESVTQAVCDLALRFGESVHDEEAMMSRPFGVALLIAGIDELGPQLLVFLRFCKIQNRFNNRADITLILPVLLYDTTQKPLDQVQRPLKANYRTNGIRYINHSFCSI
jgi:hypothetical protein